MDVMAKKIVSLASIDLSTRHKRKVAISLVIDLITKIRFAEQDYLARMPPHLYGSAAYIAAEDTIDNLIAATLAFSESEPF
jgi:hypothetical protein